MLEFARSTSLAKYSRNNQSDRLRLISGNAAGRVPLLPFPIVLTRTHSLCKAMTFSLYTPSAFCIMPRVMKTYSMVLIAPPAAKLAVVKMMIRSISVKKSVFGSRSAITNSIANAARKYVAVVPTRLSYSLGWKK